MSPLEPSTSSLQTTGTFGQGPKLDESQRQSPHAAPVHILDDDSLLTIFYLYRPTMFDIDEDDADRILGGKRWDREQWWYKLAQVCRRWRILILGSASYLGVYLVCTNGTPVADMLAHSPPLPLVVDYFPEYGDIIAEEEAIIVALEHRDRVRRIRLGIPFPNPQKLIMAINGEYAMLEYLIIFAENNGTGMALMLPETFRAPHLRHLTLRGFAFPMESRLLTTAVGLITLSLYMVESAYFRPSTLLQWISYMPQLETLMLDSLFPVPNRDEESQPVHTPVTTHVTLPNLRWFAFQGGSAYLEEVISRIITPRLEEFSIEFYKQLTYSVPRLVQFMNTTKFDSAKFAFSSKQISVKFYFREEVKTNTLSIYVYCSHLDWQVSSVAQLFNSLGQMFSAVEYLTLKQEVYIQSSDELNEVNRTVWRRLLRSFSNVKTLRVDDGLVEELSRCLRQDGEEHPLELLPELQKLTYCGRGNADGLTSFIEARQNSGRPVDLMCHRPLTLSASITNSDDSNSHI